MKSTPDKIESYVEIISSIIAGCKFERYLELGIWNGANFKRVVDSSPTLLLAVGVDLLPLSAMVFRSSTSGKITIYPETSTHDFFSRSTVVFDCIFIDANHNYADVIRDFELSMQFLEDDGVIFLHDTYPPDQAHLSGGHCSDCYRAYFDILNRGNVCECVTLPTWCGLTIVRKRSEHKKLLTIEV